MQKLLKDIYMFKIIGKRNQRYILYLSNVFYIFREDGRNVMMLHSNTVVMLNSNTI
jgi:hypothetical protein